ncbi:MAG: glutamate--cysteine ligase [Maricaulaceae bacterium]|jgi:glutamate--cysteine ligase
MSTAGAFDPTPVESMADLAAWLEAGSKPAADWRIGTEHEKFGFNLKTHEPLPFENPNGGPSVRKMLEGFQRFGWAVVEEDGFPIGCKRDGASLSLEPGGQFELSGAPVETVHQTCAEASAHLNELREIAEELGAGFMGVGFAPTWSLEDMPRVPKARYGLMRAYMAKVGRLGREMMFRTATVQVNVDFSSEADMVKKLRVALALQPLVTALFANSPFSDGRLNGWQSLRAHIWTDTDPDRTGMLPFAFEDGFGFEAYVDWAVDVPMYFVRRNDQFIDAQGCTFRQFLDGRYPAAPGERPSLGDWEDHLSTLFPEARVKRFIETRGADSGPWARICALPAFWTGLLYDQSALDAAWDLIKPWTAPEREAMRLTAPMLGLNTPTPIGPMKDLAAQALEIASAGLKARDRRSAAGDDETLFLKSLREIVARGRTPAEELIALYKGEWGGAVEPAFEACAY